MAEEQKIEVFQYSDKRYPWESKDKTSIAGLSLLFTVYDSYQGPVRFQKSVGNGITILTSPNYRAIIFLTSNDLSLTPNEYYYVISNDDPGSGDVYTFGVFEIKAPRVGNRPL